jgi:hypothetical protein
MADCTTRLTGLGTGSQLPNHFPLDPLLGQVTVAAVLRLVYLPPAPARVPGRSACLSVPCGEIQVGNLLILASLPFVSLGLLAITQGSVY